MANSCLKLKRKVNPLRTDYPLNHSLGALDALLAHAFYNVFDLAESTIKSLAEKFYPKGTGYLISPV